MNKSNVINSFSLLKAINDFYKSDDENVDKVVEALVDVAKNNIMVIMPLGNDYFNSFSTNSDNDPVIKDGFEINTRLISADEEVPLFPVFTSVSEVNKGEKTDYFEIPILQVFLAVLMDEDIGGIVINPWSNSFLMPKDMVDYVFNSGRPIRDDEKMFIEGMIAVENGKLKKAFDCFKKAAFDGNVRALGKLGDCHYKGIGTEINIELARNAWEKAALFGEIYGLYKLGDMYLNGDIERDRMFANELYRRAYLTSLEADKPEDYHIEICIRVLKNAREYIADDVLEEIANDIVESFEDIIPELSDEEEEVYYEAKKILDSQKQE